MAYKHFILPPLKVTHRPAFGPKSVDVVERVQLEEAQAGFKGKVEEKSGNDSLDLPLGNPGANAGPSFMHESDEGRPSNYELESKAAVSGWMGIREKIRIVVTEAAAMPLGQVCVSCNGAASLRCQQCGPYGFYCLGCFESGHSRVNFFHVAEKWEVCLVLILVCGVIVNDKWSKRGSFC